MLFQQVSIAILGLAVATEAAIIPEFDGLGQLGLIRRQNNRFGGGNRGGNQGGNNQAKASSTAAAAAATSAAATNNNGGGNNNNNNNNAGAAAGGDTCLDSSVIQANSNKVSRYWTKPNKMTTDQSPGWSRYTCCRPSFFSNVSLPFSY